MNDENKQKEGKPNQATLLNLIYYAVKVQKGFKRIYYGSDYVENYFNARTLINLAKNVTLLNHHLLTENERRLIPFIKQPKIEKIAENDEMLKFTKFE